MAHASTTIRPATPGDVEAIVPLFDGYRQFYAQPSNPAAAREFLTERFRRGDSTVFLAESAGQAVGFTQLFPTFSSVSLARAFVLNDLFVLAEFRRFRVGQRLLAAAVEFCRSAGAVRVSLSTAVTNDAARALYESSGWRRQTDFDVYVLKL
jgi:GNAT superfamily N-acetyltransferase